MNTKSYLVIVYCVFLRWVTVSNLGVKVVFGYSILRILKVGDRIEFGVKFRYPERILLNFTVGVTDSPSIYVRYVRTKSIARLSITHSSCGNITGRMSKLIVSSRLLEHT